MESRGSGKRLPEFDRRLSAFDTLRRGSVSCAVPRRPASRTARIALVLAAAVISASAPALCEPLADTVDMKAMSWIEIRELVNCGYSTVILPTGGIEQNGPHMALGKHDYIVTYAAQTIARKLGNAVVAPVVSFVPQGDFSPPTGNMRFPGTIGVTEPAFELLLDNVIRSLKLAGFKTILLIGDHGPSQAVQSRLAAKLSEDWRAGNVRVVNVDRYYDDRAQYDWLEGKGTARSAIGIHAGLIDTSELLAVDERRVNPRALDGLSEQAIASQGGSGAPDRANAELGRTLIAMRIEAALTQIQALAKH